MAGGWELAGVGRKWPSGHEIERGLALETARGTGKTPRASTWAYDGRSRACERWGGSAAAALAGVGRSGVPGLVLGCGLVQKNECGMRNPLGSYAGSGEDLGRSRDGGGGCARRSIAGVRSRGCWGATDYDF